MYHYDLRQLIRHSLFYYSQKKKVSTITKCMLPRTRRNILELSNVLT